MDTGQAGGVYAFEQDSMDELMEDIVGAKNVHQSVQVPIVSTLDSYFHRFLLLCMFYNIYVNSTDNLVRNCPLPSINSIVVRIFSSFKYASIQVQQRTAESLEQQQ